MCQVEGVGLGALAAAGKHGKFELEKLATWKAGQPVPFAFLADTFEAIAEESKRLIITSLLVGSAMPAVYACLALYSTSYTLHQSGTLGEAIKSFSSLPHGVGFAVCHHLASLAACCHAGIEYMLWHDEAPSNGGRSCSIH